MGDYLDRTREDELFLREKKVRKQVLDVLNKQEVDFEEPEEYDDYLAKVETYVDVLLRGTEKQREQVKHFLDQER